MNKLFSGKINLTVLLLCLFFVFCGDSSSEADSQKFLQLMPAGTVFYLGFEDWKVLRDETGVVDFITAIKKINLCSKIKDMLMVCDGIPKGVGQVAGRLEEWRNRISLWELLGGEVAVGVFFQGEEGPPVLVCCCSLPQGQEKIYAECFEELPIILGFSRRQLDEKEIDYQGETMVSFSLPGLLPGRFCRAAVGNNFILATSMEGMQLIISRLKGDDKVNGLLEDPAFKEYFQGLELSAKGIIFFDNDSFLRYAGPRLESALEKNVSFSADDSTSAELLYYCRGIVKILRAVKAIAGNSDITVDGYRERVRFFLDEKNGSKSLLEVLRQPPGPWEVLDYIPVDVADLSVTYVSLDKIYNSLLEFVFNDPLRGEELSIVWKEFQKEIKFNPEKDILSWLGNELAVCTLSLSHSLFDPGTFAFICKVTSKEKLDVFLEKLLGRAVESSINVVIDEYAGFKMRIFYFPIPLLPCQPTVGQVGEYLITASRKDGFINIIDTYLKEKDSVKRNPDFIRLKKQIGNEGTGIFFSRLEDKIDSLITFIKSSAATVGIFIASAEPMQETKPVPPSNPQAIISLLNDITDVMSKLKFLCFRAGISRYENGYIEVREFIEIN